jgi:hypothetical protein
MDISSKTGVAGTGKGTGIGIMIGGPSTGGLKDILRPIGMKAMGGINPNTTNGRMGDLPGIKEREISGMEGEERFREGQEEGRAINLFNVPITSDPACAWTAKPEDALKMALSRLSETFLKLLPTRRCCPG